MKHQIARSLVGVALSAGVCLSAFAAAAPAGSQVIALYEGVAPGSEGWTQKEASMDLSDPRFTPPNTDTLVWNVVKPTLTVIKPAAGKANGTAIVIAPGGGFRVLSWQNEGLRVAQWLADRGITAFVLKYRLNRMPDDPAEVRKGMDQMMAAVAAARAAPGSAAGAAPPMPRLEFGPVETAALGDGQQAVKIVRQRAKEFGIDPQRVGIIGFSAGGAVSGGSTVRAAPADRANFVGIIYAGVPGDFPAKLPPAFLAAAADDVLASSMPELFNRWRATGATAELHIYAKGEHGFGTVKQGLPVDHWLDAFHAWLAQQGFVPKAT